MKGTTTTGVDTSSEKKTVNFSASTTGGSLSATQQAAPARVAGARLSNLNVKEIIDFWKEELEDRVKAFSDQAHKVAEWDRQLIANGDKVNHFMSLRVLFNEWADSEGNLGPIYGAQWRSWKTPDGSTIDQIDNVIQQIKDNPYSRRHLVVAFNPGELDKMALPPCHAFFQFFVSDGRLSCQLYQRSADVFLGVPFNIASYSLLTMMIAQVCDLAPGEFVHTMGDTHLYTNHIEQAKLQISRDPRPLPRMVINPERKTINDFVFEDFQLLEYDPHPHIKAEVSV